jgi:predicted dehydrogenase
MLNIALVGYGYWGKKLYPFLQSEKIVNIAYIVDKKSDTTVSPTNGKYAPVEVVEDYQTVLQNPSIDAVLICTPTANHYQHVKQALMHNKHVLCAKPLCFSVAHAQELTQLAAERQCQLIVDYTPVFSSAMRQIKYCLGQLGKIRYIDLFRQGIGRFSKNSSVVWDFMVHDVAILDYLMDEMPLRVSASGIKHSMVENYVMAYAHLWYPENLMVTLKASWITRFQDRQLCIGGEDAELLFDEKKSRNNLCVDRHHQSKFSPDIENTDDEDYLECSLITNDAIVRSIENFYNLTQATNLATTYAQNNIRITLILSKILESLNQHGSIVDVAAS